MSLETKIDWAKIKKNSVVYVALTVSAAIFGLGSRGCAEENYRTPSGYENPDTSSEHSSDSLYSK